MFLPLGVSSHLDLCFRCSTVSWTWWRIVFPSQYSVTSTAVEQNLSTETLAKNFKCIWGYSSLYTAPHFECLPSSAIPVITPSLLLWLPLVFHNSVGIAQVHVSSHVTAFQRCSWDVIYPSHKYAFPCTPWICDVLFLCVSMWCLNLLPTKDRVSIRWHTLFAFFDSRGTLKRWHLVIQNVSLFCSQFMQRVQFACPGSNLNIHLNELWRY